MKWDEYQSVASDIVAWVGFKVEILRDRDFPDTVDDMKVCLAIFFRGRDNKRFFYSVLGFD